jgi:hypothetical protein
MPEIPLDNLWATLGSILPSHNTVIFCCQLSQCTRNSPAIRNLLMRSNCSQVTTMPPWHRWRCTIVSVSTSDSHKTFRRNSK